MVDGVEDEDSMMIITDDIINATLDELLSDRKKPQDLKAPTSRTDVNIRTMEPRTAKPPQTKTKTETATKEESEEEVQVAGGGGGNPDCGILEEIVVKLGYDASHEKKIELVMKLKQAETGGLLPKDITDYVMENYPKAPKNESAITTELRPQIAPLLYGMRNAIKAETARRAELARLAEEERKKAEEEHRKKMEKLDRIGRCPAGFSWHREGSGWRCGGGSHFVTDAELNRC